jgi:hypothetical protein
MAVKPSAQYVAGFLDGEGYVSRSGFRIEILNTCRPVLWAIKRRVKVGKVILRSKSGQGNHLGRKKQYKHQILGRLNVQHFLKIVLPYVIVKRKRCIILATARNKKEIRRMNHGR